MLQAHVIRRIAVSAECDPRTVSRYLADGKVRASCAERIVRALKQLGIPIPDHPKKIDDSSNSER